MIKNQYHEEDIKLGILSNFAVVWRAYDRGMNKDEQGCVCKPTLSLLIFMIKCTYRLSYQVIVCIADCPTWYVVLRVLKFAININTLNLRKVLLNIYLHVVSFYLFKQ